MNVYRAVFLWTLWIVPIAVSAQSVELPMEEIDLKTTKGPVKLLEVKFFEAMDSNMLEHKLNDSAYHRVDSTRYDDFGNEILHSSSSDYHSFRQSTFYRYRDSLPVYEIKNDGEHSVGCTRKYDRYGQLENVRYFHLDDQGKPVYDSSHTVDRQYGSSTRETDSLFHSQILRISICGTGLRHYDLYCLKMESSWRKTWLRKNHSILNVREYHDTLGSGIAQFYYGGTGKKTSLNRGWFAQFDSSKRMTNERFYTYVQGQANGIPYDSSLLWAYDYDYDSLGRLQEVKETRFGRDYQLLEYHYTGENLTQMIGTRVNLEVATTMVYDSLNHLISAEVRRNNRVHLVYEFSDFDEHENWRRCVLIPYGGDQRQVRLRKITYRD